MSRLTRETVLELYNLFPFKKHPLWTAALSGSLNLDQVLRAETQHFIRSNIGRQFCERAAKEAAAFSQRASELLWETYKEECTDDDSGPSHVDLIRRLLVKGGVTEEDLLSARPTPGNMAAISIYKDITDRGPIHHMIGAGAVEYYYSQLSPSIFEAYLEHYGMSEAQAETYRIHGPMDLEHAERALAILDEPIVQAQSEGILLAVRDAFVATSLHYDGMLQAAIGNTSYWNGK